MTFSLLQSVRATYVASRTCACRISRFGTYTVLRNQAQDGDGSRPPSSPKADDVLQMMRNFSRQNRERGPNRERGETPTGTTRQVSANSQWFAERGSQTATSAEQQTVQGEPASIFDRLTRQKASERLQANSRTERYEKRGQKHDSADRSSRNEPKTPEKPPTAPLKRVVLEKQLPTHSHWVEKQSNVGRSAFDEKKAQRRQKAEQAVKPSDEPSDELDETDVLYSTLQLEVSGHDEAVLRSYAEFLRMAVHGLGFADSLEGIWTTPCRFYRRTLLKSNFVHKLHRRQYEIRTYFLHARLARLTGSTADTLLEYIQRNLPEGTAMKVSYQRIEPLPSRILQALTAASQSSPKLEGAAHERAN